MRCSSREQTSVLPRADVAFDSNLEKRIHSLRLNFDLESLTVSFFFDAAIMFSRQDSIAPEDMKEMADCLQLNSDDQNSPLLVLHHDDARLHTEAEIAY